MRKAFFGFMLGYVLVSMLDWSLVALGMMMAFLLGVWVGGVLL